MAKDPEAVYCTNCASAAELAEAPDETRDGDEIVVCPECGFESPYRARQYEEVIEDLLESTTDDE